MNSYLTRKEFVVPAERSEIRIDQFLALMMPEISRRKIRLILDVGGCFVNNKRMHIASRSVRPGDKIRVEFNLDALKRTQNKKFVFSESDILFDQYHIIAVNKPPGLPSQATRDQDVMHAETCLRQWLKDRGRANERLILLHRLDKETSGVLLFATKPEVATWMTNQFREKTVKKTYWALCKGAAKVKKFTVECYLSEIDKKTGLVAAVRSGGKPSRTDFQERFRSESLNVSWMECFPETGRSHQIRVHLDMSGIPILGDKKYGRTFKEPLNKEIAEKSSFHHLLHARAIEFQPNPSAAPVKLIAEAPPVFMEVLTLIGASQGTV